MVAPNTDPDAQGNNFFARNNSRFDTYTSGIIRVDHNLGENHRFFARYGHNGRRETRAKAGREESALTAGYHHRWNNVLSVDPHLDAHADAALRAPGGGRVTAGWTSAAPRTPAASTWRRLAEHTSVIPGGSLHPRHRLWRRVDRTGWWTGRAERRLLRIGNADPDSRQAPDQVRRRVPLRDQQRREPAGRRQPGQLPVLAELHLAAAERGEPDDRRRRQRVRLVPAGLHGVEFGRPQPGFDWRSNYGGLFIQDDWRLTNRLTLNAGCAGTTKRR